MRRNLLLFATACALPGLLAGESETDIPTDETSSKASVEDLDTRVNGSDGRKAWHAVTPLEKAAFYHQQGDGVLAERGYIEILEGTGSQEDKKTALLELAEVYFDRGVIAKAVDTLESCLRAYPEIAERPEVLFRLGQFYREMDLKDESTAMFYRVLNSIVVTGETNLEKYLGLARLAQFQIARNHYELGEFERASLLFDRIDLLELDPVDRETVAYYRTMASLKAGHNKEGLQRLQAFSERFPQSDYLPEILFHEAEALYRLNRTEDSVEALLRLLETVGLPSENASGEWNFWRQQAGNKLANKLYHDGNFLYALRIYQGMVPLDADASWQLPVIYQIGLCFEKLNMNARARDSYAYIDEQLGALGLETLSESLRSLRESSRWRLELLDWKNDLNRKINDLAIIDREEVEPTEPET